MIQTILIVGLGSIGRRHARLVRSLLPAAKVVGLKRDIRGAHEADIDCLVDSMDEALRFNPQVAVIANPASHHLQTALALARAGIHLLIEKPIANSTEGLVQLIDECRSRRLILMTGYNLRFLPSLQKFREALDTQRIGTVLSVRAEVGQYLPSWRQDADYRESVSAKASLGGGALLELSHELDYLRWLFGDVAWVSAILGKQSSLEIDVEDTGHLTLSFATKAEGSSLIATLNLDFIRHDTVRSCTAIGDRGSLRWNAIGGTVDVFDANAQSWSSLYASSPQKDESYLAEWRHFIDCVRNGSAPLISGEDGLAVLRIVEAARLSSLNGAIVSVATDNAVALQRN